MTRGDEDLVAALKRRSAEVGGREIHELEVGAGRSIEDQHAIVQRGEVRV